ncbi:MAG TPA: septum formation inhibitor Maf [Microscillaceae bacterium]|nr:septum formation inhibitor Maf [Microscillaceae bacterium]
MRKVAILVGLLIALVACDKATQNNLGIASQEASASAYTTSSTKTEILDDAFNKYWYQGKAEITSYKLSQARYGEIHEGSAVLIYVTEPFLPQKQVKADYPNKQNVPVLKLNRVKKFLTGIYPYSLMTSVFSPVNMSDPAIKTTFTSQEWCGQTFMQFNNRKKWEVTSRSYFESHGDQNFTLSKDLLEDDIWTKIRLNPKKLPTGKTTMIPGAEFLTLKHRKVKAYKVVLSLEQKGKLSTYKIAYPQLQRTLAIQFQANFPYTIESWEEVQSNRSGSKSLVTKATRIKRIKSAYWNRHTTQDTYLYKELGL